MRIDRETLRLENRLKRLEKLVYEKTVGRGSNDSRAYTIWKLLRDNGPMTRPEIRNALGYTTPIVEMEQENCVFKNGNTYSYNPDYNWEDVGVIPRTADQERAQMGPSAADMRAAMQNMDVQDEEPSGRRTRTPRAPREPRQPRQRTVVPNLFSRKYDEVKAAIDAGQDCTAANEKGITPIMYACRDPKGQSGSIVELLLEHGANANDDDGSRRIIFTAIKNKNYDAVKSLVNHGANLKVLYRRQYPFQFAANEWEKIDNSNFDAFKSLVNQSLNNRMFAFESILALLDTNAISNSHYDELIREVYDSHGSCIDMYGGDMVVSELASNRNPTTSLDLFVNRNHKLPSMSNYAVKTACLRNSFVRDKLYNLFKDAADGKIGTGRLSTFLQNAKTIFEAKGEDTSRLYEIVTPELIRELSRSDYSRSDLDGMVYNSIKSGNTALLKKIADAKLTNLDGDSIVDTIAYGGNRVNDSAVPLALRIAGRCSDIKRSLHDYTMDRIVRSTNKYLIDWVIDRGYGQQLEDYINTRNYNVAYMSQEFRDAFEKAGFALSGKRDAAGNRVAYNRAANTIIKAISTDVWNNTCNNLIAQYPQLLEDDDVLDAIKENPDSITGRQLQRRIDAIEKEPLKYDF